MSDAMSYAEIAKEVVELVEAKQRAYGNSHEKAGEVMRVLYPTGIPPEQMDDALTLVRMIDKMFRVATDRDAFGEDPFFDLAGYALLSCRRRRGGKR